MWSYSSDGEGGQKQQVADLESRNITLSVIISVAESQEWPVTPVLRRLRLRVRELHRTTWTVEGACEYGRWGATKKMETLNTIMGEKYLATTNLISFFF